MSTYRGLRPILQYCLNSVLNVKAVIPGGFQPGEGPSGHLRDYEATGGPSFLVPVCWAGESLGRKECPMSGVRTLCTTDRCQGAA